MFSFLVALALYLTFTPSEPMHAISDFSVVRATSFLTIAAEAKQPPLVVPNIRGPVKIDESRLGVETHSTAALVMDWETKKLLFAKNPDEALSIASITKLMAALVVLSEEPDWGSILTITGNDMRPGGIPYVIPGEVVTEGRYKIA